MKRKLITLEQRIPGTWDRLLRKVQAVEPQAFIAGGCLRDLHMQRDVKDIDIFLKWSPGIEDRLEEALDMKMVTEIGEAQAYGASMQDVIGVLNGPNIGKVPVQLVLLDGGRDWTPVTVIGRFDFGICQICYDRNRVEVTRDFVTDTTKSTYTLINSETEPRRRRSIRRYMRHTKPGGKYEGFKLVSRVEGYTPEDLIREYA